MGNSIIGSKEMQPPISVTALMPIRNGLKFIPNARYQLSNCCRANDEILIVNDNSTDGTLLELQKWALEDSRVRIINNEGEGLVSALNLGVKESSNNWIARFDVDDKYNLTRIQKQISVFDSETVAIFSDYKIFDLEGILLGTIPSPVDSDAVEISLINSRRTAHPSVLFSKEAVDSVGGYRSDDFPAEDLSLWLRISRVGKLVSVPEVLLNYELGLNSVSAKMRGLILRKTKGLIHDIGVKESSLKLGLERADEILDGYMGLRLVNERQLLFLQELSKALKISGESKQLLMLEKLIKRLDRNLISAAISISVGAIKRRVYRKFG